MTDKLRQAAEMALQAMCSFKTATGGRFSVHQLDGYDVFGTEIETLRKAIAEPPNSTTDVVEPYNGWVLRNVYFEDGEPLMHSEPENTQTQELFGKTEQLEAEIKRLQELADYRLKLLTKMPSEWVGLTDQEINDCLTFNFYRLTLLTKMPSEWVGLTDEDIAELRRNGAHSVSDADFRTIEARLKELNT